MKVAVLGGGSTYPGAARRPVRARREPGPPEIRGLLAQVKAYEELTVTAAAGRDRRAALLALVAHQCPCGGRRSIVAIVTDTALARALLASLGLATEPVTFALARAPPQADLPWDDAS
jgi:hypothetical protein